MESDQPSEMSVAPEGETLYVRFISAIVWTAEVKYSGEATGWVELGTSGGDGGSVIQKVKLTVTKNTSKAMREATLVIKSGDVSELVVLKQNAVTETNKDDGDKNQDDGQEDAKNQVFSLEDGEAEVAPESGTFTVTVPEDDEYTCSRGI